MTTAADNTIRTRSCPDCYVCATTGEPLYQGLRDRLFGAPGQWNLKRCPNTDCGLLWLDPMPIEEDIGKAYESYYTHDDVHQLPDTWLRRLYRRVKNGYVANEFGYEDTETTSFDRLLARLIYLHPGRRADFDLSVFYLNAQPNGYLLDVGCGSGAMLKSIADRGWRVEGVDFDPKAVQNAQAKGLKVHLGSLEEQKFPDNTFDAITMSHLIEHMPDPLGLLRECHRILKPGGCLVTVTPNAFSWGHRLYGSDWRGLEPPRHLSVFTPHALINAVRHAGFTEVCCRAIPRARGILLASRMLQRSGWVDLTAPTLLTERLWAEGMEFLEWLVGRVDKAAGEELVLTATEP